MTSKGFLPKVARKVLEEATSPALGSPFKLVISFHLQQRFGKDPYEVLLEDPKSFYDGLKAILSDGAETVVRLIGRYLAEECGIKSYSSEEFVRLMASGDNSAKHKISDILTKVAEKRGYLPEE